MASSSTFELMQIMITGLQTLQDEYVQLFEQHAALEHKLNSAREQYNELAKAYGRTIDTPPLSLASASISSKKGHKQPLSAIQILRLRDRSDAARQLEATEGVVEELLARSRTERRTSFKDNDVQESSRMPAISESAMEQDFTIPGTPSMLGCPFASMSGKKLSSHAASVLSRYHGSQHDARASSRESISLREFTNGPETFPQKTARRSSSLVDPVKAESCGLERRSRLQSKSAQDISDVEDTPRNAGEAGADATDAGVCPIRFLNQHSPEELATYFERHKHELPRSHEICVRRYQSNEEQVRELDARYGDVAQMIRGLGEKHQSFLPKDPEDDVDVRDSADDSRVQQWAQELESQHKDQPVDLAEDGNRLPHFARPLRDVRVGESPSRPWGIHVPPDRQRAASDASSVPAQINIDKSPEHAAVRPAQDTRACPFAKLSDEKQPKPASQTMPTVLEDHIARATSQGHDTPTTNIFKGPIIVGYKAEEAAEFLNRLGYHGG